MLGFHYMTEEIITLYLADTPDTPVSCARMEYYDNCTTTYGKHHPGIIDVLLFNAHGDVLLQKRGRNKRVNPGKLSVTIGGHISWGDNADLTVVQESLEELGAPAMVFSPETFANAYEKFGEYTSKMALICNTCVYFRDFSEHPIEQRRDIKDRVWLYFGRYDGPIAIPDRQSAGYEWIDLDTLEREFQAHPEQFAENIKHHVEEHGDAMWEFVKRYSKRLS